ncbi:glycosyl transferase family 2 [Rippkaea orientalis PCC 8801]|uniref:Glycosyl transferase family 2 n=1 Tax=Rippkaea orientalis (strain PCC 8801 / RF-1) TaxID=41431 RepID=B7K286_RIPO1|nr:glycosyltransferase family 2 protein [Rippkaea orientalis]ACK65222.1 glycosyl transferase family 2 [Rippkaea orientalis PCC 8801]
MISIITPVYNGEKFIESCIKVVLEQNCTDIEHIIIDGGSKDSTVEIIKQYAAKYSHIRWISEQDQGQSDALNKGIIMAKGEILGLLNVDDFYEPNVLNKVSKMFSTLPQPTLVVANCNIWDNEGNLKQINKPNKLKITDLLLGWTFAPPPVNPSAYFYHKSLHDKIGLYDINEHYAMDIDFLLRAVQAAHVKYIDEIWGNFRYLENTKSYQDFQRNQAIDRYNRMLDTYRKKLSATLQIYLAILVRIKYFWRHPQDLIPSITKRITFNK